MPNKQQQVAVLYAQPIVELLHAAAVMGEGFERRISHFLPQQTAENCAALHLRAARALKLVKRLTKGDHSREARAAREFLHDLVIDFEEVSRNAQDALRRHKGVSNG